MDPVVAEISKETEVPIPASPRRSRKFSALIISGFVLIVVASFFGGTYYQAMSQKKVAMTISPSPALGAPTPTIDPAANWKVYISDRYQYSFKYPADAKITEDTQKGETNQEDTIVTVSLDGGKLVFTPNGFDMGVAPIRTQNVVIGGVPTTKYYIAEDRGLYTEIESSPGAYKMNIDFTLPKDTTVSVVDGSFDQILKTFQFTQSDQVTTDTSQWKTYVFPKAGITFKYPPIYLLGNESAKGTGQEVSFGVSEKEIQGLKQCFVPGQKPECQSYSLDVNVVTASKADYPTVEAFMNGASPASPSEFHAVRVGGLEASRLDQGSEQSGAMTATVFVTLKDSYVEIGLSSNFNPQDNQRYFDQILQSFTFAN
jgi:hypothetical protein